MKIKNSYTDATIYEAAATSAKRLVEAAVEAKIILSGADLSGANLRGANLRGANLRGADLSGANLRGAYLSEADLRGAYVRAAYLRGADLREADLRGADLSGADLRRANLSGADLREAYLSEADLRGADLSEAYLSEAKDDLMKVLAAAPDEVSGLREAMVAGKIDGSQYSGECACLVGTIANLRKCDVDSLAGITRDSSRPAERWFIMFKPGDTPKNHQLMKMTVGWLDEFLKSQAVKP
jgi:uncharacterized protein YjbI with pentapeptide repeats